VARALDRGLHLGEALLGAPGFITPQVADMLRVGERTGTLPAVLPVCRQSLHDTSSRVLSGVNYLVVILMFVSPAGLAVGPFLSLMILPKFIEIMRDIAGDAPLPAFLQLLHLHWREIVVAQVGVIVALVAGAVFYALGPRLFGWLPELQALCDRWTWRLPWKRQRALRDFSATLAVLLDAGLPEDRALTLAAECADQTVLRHRTADIIADLRNGARLTDAVAVLDRTGEFRWRLTNAAHGATGFRAALAGWHETLAARAFQQEQVVSQLITTALVLVNATLVAALAIGVFQCLATIMGGAGIW
jgi:type II secretory pathway component PulF